MFLFVRFIDNQRAVLQFAETMPRVTEAPVGVRVSCKAITPGRTPLGIGTAHPMNIRMYPLSTDTRGGFKFQLFLRGHKRSLRLFNQQLLSGK